jgi:hypothetical protein
MDYARAQAEPTGLSELNFYRTEVSDCSASRVALFAKIAVRRSVAV